MIRIGAILAVALSAGVAAAQQLRLETVPEPHYAGEAIEIHLIAEGFDEDPAPTIEVGPPSDGILVLHSHKTSLQLAIKSNSEGANVA